MTTPELRGLAAEWRELKAAQARLDAKEKVLKKHLTEALGDQEAIAIEISDRERYVLKRVARDSRKPNLVKLAELALQSGLAEENFTLTLTEEDTIRLMQAGVITREEYESVLEGKVSTFAEMRLQEIEKPEEE